MGETINTLNKNITLHPDRISISDKLKLENCNILAWVILTGKSLAGYDITQAEYDEDIEAALSDD